MWNPFSVQMFCVIGVLILASTSWALTPHSGSCPPTLPVNICEPRCGPDASCSDSQLCCPTECGGSMCVDPVSKRHFVNLVRPGKCPEIPRGRWICTTVCTSDGDCPGTLKCCTNRCGAQTCQRPDPEDEEPEYAVRR